MKMKRMKRTVSLLLAAALIGSSAGLVQAADPAGEAAAAVTVKAASADVYGAIEPGQTVTGVSGDAGTTVRYSFDAAETGLYTVTVSAEFTGTVEYGVYDEGGSGNGAYSYAGEDVYETAFALDGGGTYYIDLCFNDSDNVSYTLALSECVSYYEGQCGDDAYWSFNTDTGILTITGSGDLYSYEEEDAYYNLPWNYVKYDMLGVSIGSGITGIGDYAFSSCYWIQTVSLPGTLESIGAGAFSGCDDLESITLPTGLLQIGANAFYGCDSLTSVTIPSTVTQIGDGAFASCGKLKAIKTASGNTAYVSVSGVLFNADQTTLVAYPVGKTSASYTIPSTVTQIGAYAFYDNENFTSITVPGTVKTIGDSAFSGCTYVSSLKLGKGIETIGDDAFSFIGDYMYGTSKLSKVVIPEGVTSIGDSAFYHVVGLSSVSLPDSLLTIGDYAFGKDGCFEGKLTQIDIPENVTTIGAGAFFGSALTYIVIPASVTQIGCWAFASCSDLENVVFEGDAPECLLYDEDAIDGDEYEMPVLAWSTATVYYYSDASGYTSDFLNSLGGEEASLTFKEIGRGTSDFLFEATISLAYAKTAYSGKALKPAVTVKQNGTKLKKGTDYTVSYSNNKKIGVATVTVKGKGDYIGTVTKTFTIVPPTVTVKSAKSTAKKQAKITWKKTSGSVTKYQIRYRVKGTKKWTTKTVSASKASLTIKKLKSGKTYQVQVRAVKTIDYVKYTGSWSKTKTVKVK